jgi:hypothetical protein
VRIEHVGHALRVGMTTVLLQQVAHMRRAREAFVYRNL